ncbi:hypothetical protein B0H16DRAFT_1806725 [Mycena metata]|uniref:Uncharacterized protein n=1 Tax=Mycena metata TaxID=1033252 RepID=A0AAD7MFI8_9AGAR|nr:hypothetical protein B0H16DRAFT_1806725 [Mycena metata]
MEASGGERGVGRNVQNRGMRAGMAWALEYQERTGLLDVELDVFAGDHRAAGISLSGRVLHVCHYLPVQATLNRSSTSPDDAPLTPTPEADSPVLEEKSDDVWTLVPRYGHAAVISVIHSLAAYHRQAAPPAAPLSSSTASLPPPSTPQPIPTESVTEEERAKLEEAWGRTSPPRRTIARRYMCRCGWRTRLRMDIMTGIVNP